MMWYVIGTFVLTIVLRLLHIDKPITSLLTTLLFYVGLPLLVIDGLLRATIDISAAVPIFIYICVLVLITLATVKKLRFPKKQKGGLFLNTTFGNMSFFGLPLCTYFFGIQGTFYAILTGTVTGLVHWGLGPGLAGLFVNKRKFLLGTFLKNPFMYAIILGSVLRYFEVVSPPEIQHAYMPVTLAAIYVVLATIQLKPSTLFSYWKQVSLSAFFKFLVSPLLMGITLLSFNIPNKEILIFLAVMPPAIANTVLAKELKLDYKMTSTVTGILSAFFLTGVAIATLN